MELSVMLDVFYKFELSNMVAISHMQVLNTWNAVSVTNKPIFLKLILVELNLNSHK